MKNPDAASARTVGGRDALARLLELEPDEHLHLHGAVHDTVDRWNQVKHLGLAEEPTPEQLLAHAASFGRVVNALLRAPADDFWGPLYGLCLLYPSEAADERSRVALGGRRIVKKKKTTVEMTVQ